MKSRKRLLISFLVWLITSSAYAEQCFFVGNNYICVPTIDTSSINWTSVQGQQIQTSGINWPTVTNQELQNTGINWSAVQAQQIQTEGINWVSVQNSEIYDTGINWAKVTTDDLQSADSINWTTVTGF